MYRPNTQQKHHRNENMYLCIRVDRRIKEDDGDKWRRRRCDCSNLPSAKETPSLLRRSRCSSRCRLGGCGFFVYWFFRNRMSRGFPSLCCFRFRLSGFSDHSGFFPCQPSPTYERNWNSGTVTYRSNSRRSSSDSSGTADLKIDPMSIKPWMQNIKTKWDPGTTQQ